MRLDAYLVSTGLCRSRATAAEAIKTSGVTVNGKTVTKPSFEIKGDEAVAVNAVNEKYVSRGGYKLEAALDAFGINVQGCDCVDIGASTGGFSDCLLQRGASTVLAIDSGSDQLAPKLKSDPRVISLENTNIRTFSPEGGSRYEFICTDVSFISLRLVLPAIDLLLSENGIGVCLIKPQFEAGKKDIGKNGVVREPAVYRRVLHEIIEAAEQCSLRVTGLIESPITGGDGNIEFLCLLSRDGESVSTATVNNTVLNAVKLLRGK